MMNLASAFPIKNAIFSPSVRFCGRTLFSVYSPGGRIYSDEVVTMTLSHPRQILRSLLTGGLLFAFCVGLLRWPAAAASAAKNGLLLCGDLIIPSLFPFFILSTLTVSLGFSALLGRLLEPLMQPLFHQSGAGASALVLGFIGGYPVGAKTVCTLYQEQLCTREQAQSLLAFCNNSGPAFIIGAAGIAVFQSSKVGFILMAIQILSALLVGILLRPSKQARTPELHRSAPVQRKSVAKCITESVGQSATATLNICAYVILFNVMIQLLDSCGFLDLCETLLSLSHCPAVWQKGLLAGILELSNGISALTNTPSALIPAAFLLSWGGLSVHCQTLSLLQGYDLNIRRYLLGKLLQACLSAALACLFLQLFPAALATLQFSSSPAPAPAWLPTAGRWAGLIALALSTVLLAAAAIAGRKSTGK